MKTTYYFLATLLLACSWLQLTAQDGAEGHDTLYIYQSWESILDSSPDHRLLDPYIEVVTPCDIYFEADNPTADAMLHDESVAVALGDTLWLVNTQWLNEYFEGDCRKMDDWVPLYFTAKIAFLQWQSVNFFGIRDEVGDLYLIDFERARVDKIDDKLLTALLEPYPDLQRRYVSMKDYKKKHVIEFYFMEYVHRLDADPTVPPIC